MRQAIVLCSGGLDSSVVAYYVKNKRKFGKIKLIFLDYGQKARYAERASVKYIAKKLKTFVREINLDLRAIPSGLTGPVRIGKIDLNNTLKESKKWYFPARNLIFLSYAIAEAEKDFIEKKYKSDIFVGFKSEGREHYPDTTPSFVRAVNLTAKEGTESKPRILAPFADKDKEDIIIIGKRLGVDLGKTFSCYLGKKRHCGGCLACLLRKKSFYWANLKDPTFYER
ncbi:MAG: 7-cyano-7-deazaguanine synthase [Nanoarchaeota archaeon]